MHRESFLERFQFAGGDPWFKNPAGVYNVFFLELS
jgi:hypothetical protein